MSFSRSGSTAPAFSFPIGYGSFTDVNASNAVFTSNVYSSFYHGDGGLLSNVISSIPGSLPNLVVSNSLTTTNVYASNIADQTGTFGTTGQVLTKAAAGTLWAAPPAIYSQWTTGTGNIYYLSNVGIGTSSVSANLTVAGNVYASNALTTTNIFANTLTLANASSTINVIGSVTASTFYGAIAGSNTVSASTLTGDGSGITSLNMGNAGSGTLAVAYGGTGVTSSTGTGSVVLSSGPTLAGTTTIETLNLTNALGTTYGGTGLTSFTSGGILYASSTSTLASTAPYAAGQVLYGNGAGAAPGSSSSLFWDSVNFRLGIGITNPSSYTLQVSGTIGASGDITAFYSDERLKTKTGTLTGALDKVCSLDTFTYVNNELAQSFGFKDTKERLGLSAQQVQKVAPQTVSPAPFDAENQSGQNYLTVQYEKLVPLLIEALKEERKAREALEEKLGLK